jgi:hypothetical protein
MPEDHDLVNCSFLDMNKWSAGLDIGLTWKLDDSPTYSYEDYESKDQLADNAYTVTFSDTVNQTKKPVKKKARGPKNFLYIEAGGAGIALSHNYERTVYRNRLVSIQARAGVGALPNNVMIPFGANVTLGEHNKKFEMSVLAVAQNLLNADYYDNEFKWELVPSLAFRLESDSHFFLRLALMSHYFFETNEVMPGLGVSVGGCF